MMILDSHCDTASQIFRLRNMSEDGTHSHIDMPKLLRSGVSAVFFAAYTSNALDDSASTSYSMQLIARTLDFIRENNKFLRLAKSAGDIVNNHQEGFISILLALENGQPIQNDLSLLRLYADLGVKYITLTHGGNNQICDSCSTEEKRWHGLSPFGKEVIAEMNRLGILVDVSHISDESFYDVLKYSTKPVVATHSCCRALVDCPRNMSDEMICALAAKGGVIQINFYPPFLDAEYAKEFQLGNWGNKADAAEEGFIKNPSNLDEKNKWESYLDEIKKSTKRPSFKRVVDHIDYVVSLVGIDHVGIGSDFDGICVTPEGLDDISMIGNIFIELKNRGYSDDEISKIASGNFLRVLSQQD